MNARPSSAIKNMWIEHRSILITYLLMLLLFIVIGIISPTFFTVPRMLGSLVLAGFLGILAMSQTIVMLLGGIDLSVPWTMNLGAIVMTMFATKYSVAIGIAVTIAVGLAVGLLNGLGVSAIGIHPIIMTLGMNGIVEGLIQALTHGGGSINTPASVSGFVGGHIGPIPMMIVIWFILSLIIFICLSKTVYGKKVYATGYNERVALLSGVNTKSTTVVSYMASSLIAATAGMLLAGYLGQTYLGMGDPYLFPSIAAVVIGGVSIYGGRGNYVGVIAGAVILTLLDYLLAALGLHQAGQDVLFGVIVCIVAILVTIKKRGSALS